VSITVTDADANATTNRFNVLVTAPRTRLGITDKDGQVELHWRSNAVPWRLESTPELAPFGQWEQVTGPPAFSNESWSAVMPKIGPSAFFRLAQ